MQLADHTFLITGGGSGLGAATARRLAHAGANVIVLDLNRAAGEALSADLPAAHFIAADVTDPDAVIQALTVVRERTGALHGIVNCAGTATVEKTFGRRGPHSLEHFQQIIQTNLVGSFNVARLAAGLMAENAPNAEGERGVIIHTASIAAYEGQVGQVAYAAAKAGIVGMTLPMARDLGPLGIRVVTIAPGVFDTPLLATLPAPAVAALAAQAPFPQRLGRPPEFAALVAHVLENPMLNGAVLRLDAGLRMG
ncbi:MAG TPA: SDR family NAD(P)-dependent oxidoreductase [Caldilineaceae bacterium]|nr:SDR family NAD(P)-dependent oxidoreductase [Caldilineaceae bacterium]